MAGLSDEHITRLGDSGPEMAKQSLACWGPPRFRPTAFGSSGRTLRRSKHEGMPRADPRRTLRASAS